MRHLRLIAAVLAVAGAVVLITQPFSSSRYRVDALFDTADGIAAGMQVKVAGVPVGEVVGVKLTPGLKARIELQLNRPFAPFRTDAACEILPEGLISENYVQCDPGSPRAPALRAGDGGVPTVPLTHDSEPVSLQQFIDIFSLPVADRLQAMLNELGIATAGRGEDINAILRRANPALTQADRVLASIDAQRQQLTNAVGQTNVVVAQLARRATAVHQFVDRAAAVAETTAAHRGPLGTGIARLPALLTQVGRAAGALRDVSVNAIPLLNALHVASPALTRLTMTLPRFTAAARPAVAELTSVAAEGRKALPAATPLFTKLRRFAQDATPAASLLDELLVNLRDRGGLEYLQDFIYGVGVVGSPFDAISHLAPIDVFVTPCVTNPAAAGCNRGWGSPASREQAADSTPQALSARPTRPSSSKPAHRAAPIAPALPALPVPSSNTAGHGGAGSGLALPTTSPSSVASTLSGLLHYLLK